MRFASALVLYPVWMATGLAPKAIYAEVPTFSYPYAVIMLLLSEWWVHESTVNMIGPAISIVAVLSLVEPRWGVGILLGFTALNYVELLVSPVPAVFAFYILGAHLVRQAFTH